MRLRLIALCLAMFSLCQPAEACGRRRAVQPASQSFTWFVAPQTVQTPALFVPSPQPSAFITTTQTVLSCPGGKCPAPVFRR
jgi:hypothetical protein